MSGTARIQHWCVSHFSVVLLHSGISILRDLVAIGVRMLWIKHWNTVSKSLLLTTLRPCISQQVLYTLQNTILQNCLQGLTSQLSYMCLQLVIQLCLSETSTGFFFFLLYFLFRTKKYCIYISCHSNKDTTKTKGINYKLSLVVTFLFEKEKIHKSLKEKSYLKLP